MPVFALLFLVVPFIEIYLLITVGQLIGALPTIALCVLSALIGGAMLRQQGALTLARARERLARGEIPAGAMLEGIALAIGGALLITPGFATDALGLICLLPQSRAWLVQGMLKRVTVIQTGEATHRGPSRADVIEGEFRRED